MSARASRTLSKIHFSQEFLPMTLVDRYVSFAPLRVFLLGAALLAALAATPAFAGNIDLSTVPGRDEVELTIYNSEDLTLVRERRRVSFSRGRNRLQFSWSHTLIDPTSVEIRFPGSGEKLRLVDTVFPHERPEVLYWQVESGLDGPAEVEIDYFTSGLTWQADYTVIAAEDEGAADIEGFVRVENRSGEDYPNARVRVVVGTINLVEKIAALARIGMKEVATLAPARRDALRRRVAKRVMMVEEDRPVAAKAEAKGIIKEGLSEYFIYTIEGTETIPSGWSKRLRSFEAKAVPISVRYRLRPYEYGARPVKLFLARNDTASHLGTTPLPGGRVRVLRRSEGDALAYLAGSSVPYVPISDELELNLGANPDLVFERTPLAVWRDEIWLKLRRSGRYSRVRDGLLVVAQEGGVVGWNTHTVHRTRIGNHTGRALRLEVRERVPGDAQFVSDLPVTRHDYRTVQYELAIEAGEVRDVFYEVVRREGRNRKQEQVTLVRKRVERPGW